MGLPFDWWGGEPIPRLPAKLSVWDGLLDGASSSDEYEYAGALAGRFAQ